METFFLKRKYGFVLLCLSYFLFFLLTSAAYILFNIPIILVLLNWVLIFVISLNYESTTRDKVINTTRIITFMLFPELVIGAITGYFHFSFFADGNYSNSIGIITTKIYRSTIIQKLCINQKCSKYWMEFMVVFHSDSGINFNL